MNNLGYGALGEKKAEFYLRKNKYKILSKNCKFAGSELDIVAICSKKTQKLQILKRYKNGEIKSKEQLKYLIKSLEEILVFVEVKYSSTKVFGEPMERVDAFKQRQLIKAAEGFIHKNQMNMPCRFDVISIVGDKITHIENAFEE